MPWLAVSPAPRRSHACSRRGIENVQWIGWAVMHGRGDLGCATPTTIPLWPLYFQQAPVTSADDQSRTDHERPATQGTTGINLAARLAVRGRNAPNDAALRREIDVVARAKWRAGQGTVVQVGLPNHLLSTVNRNQPVLVRRDEHQAADDLRSPRAMAAQALRLAGRQIRQRETYQFVAGVDNVDRLPEHGD